MTTTPDAPSRRSLLKLSGLGVAGAAFLAACSKDEPKAGQSGDPVTTTLVAESTPKRISTFPASRRPVSTLR